MTMDIESKPYIDAKFWPSWWQMQKAKLFGERFSEEHNGWILSGWEYKGVKYINKLKQSYYKTYGD